MHTDLIHKLGVRVERFVVRHALGLMPDPESWPEPADASALPMPVGMEKTAENLRGRVLDREFCPSWPHRRTVIGAHGYRFEENGEYDCGWRLIDLAARLLRSQIDPPPEILMIVPPAPVFRPTSALDWSGERLARKLGCTYRPDLLGTAAPLADHADRLTKLPAPWGDLYRLNRPESVFGKRVLLCDWRWEKGKSMMAISKLLRHAKAEVVCFAWME